MATDYLWKRGDRVLGPFTVSDLRKLVKGGKIGRFQSLSNDGGATWAPASTFADIWESKELIPVEQRVPVAGGAPVAPVASAIPASPTIIVPQPDQRTPAVELATVATDTAPVRRAAGRGMGLAGFITSLSALVLTFVPMAIWAIRYEPAYATVPVIFPLLAASITGLALSAIAMSRKAGAFATTGLIVGICGSVFGLVTAIGWLASHDPREDWIRRLTATAEADLQLARRNYGAALNRYRNAVGNDRADALKDVTRDLMTLTKAHKQLLIAAAPTPRFRQHFLKVEGLRTAFVSFSESVKAVDDITPQAAIDRVGQDFSDLKALLDFLDLYLTKQLSIESVQAKFRSA